MPEGYRLLRARRPLLQIVLERLDERVCVSDAVTESIGPYFPTLGFRTILNGIDTEVFTPDSIPMPHLAGKRNIIFVGRFDPKNDVKHMLGAFTELRLVRNDVRLIVVGDGPLRALIQRTVPESLATTSSSPVASTSYVRATSRARRSFAPPVVSPRSG